MYFKKFAAFAAIAVAALLSTVNQAAATYYTTNATVQVYNPPNPPPTDDVYQVTFQQSGKAYTNQWTGGGPNAPGEEIRTITVQTVTGVLNAAGDLTPIYVDGSPAAGETAAQFIVISAVKGTVLAGPGGGNNPAVFTEGTAFATYRLGATGANALDPTTFSFANTFSQYTLVNDSVASGFPFDSTKSLDFNIDANSGLASTPGDINTSAPNTAILGGFAYFLFTESSTAAQNAAAGPDGSGFFGDDFIRNYEFPALPGLLPGAEGIVSEINQVVDNPAGYSGQIPGYAANLAVFNAIWAAAFPGEVWATGVGGGAATDWSPLAPNGDFRANISGRLAPAVQAVPEPGTLALLAIGVVGLVGYRARRRSK